MLLDKTQVADKLSQANNKELNVKIIEGDLAGSPIKINQDNATLEIRARLMVAKSYRLPQDISSFQLLSYKNFHSFEQWLIMILLAFTGVGLLISIPMYFLAKKKRFTIKIKPKQADDFVIEGNKDDWAELKPYLPKNLRH